MQPCPPNKLLLSLPVDELVRVQAHLVPVDLHAGDVLCGGGEPVAHVYFPVTAVVALVCSTRAGESLHVASIGAEGVVGLTFSPSGTWAPGRASVQRAGKASRIPASVLQHEFARGGMLQRLALQHHQQLMEQVAQTALCSRLHRVDQQLGRWILDSLDRSGGERLIVTQQQVAAMLGVRREAVSTAASRLQRQGMLHWGRGHLRVVDRGALEAHCCECYQALRCHAADLRSLMLRAA